LPSSICPYLEVPWHLLCQFLGVLCDLVVEIDGGGVLEQLALPVDGRDHLGMTVAHAHGDDPGKRLQVVGSSSQGERSGRPPGMAS